MKDIIFKQQKGFTLIEIAIVLMIVTILLGYTVAMFPIQQELKHYRQAESEMKEILDNLVAFAQVNGRLPCPDTNGDINATTVVGVIDGLEDDDDLIDNVTSLAGTDGLIDDCKAYFGYLPRATIGISGDIDLQGRLLDPWGEPYLYAVSEANNDTDSDATTAAAIDVVSPNGIQEEGLSNNLQLDLYICTDSDTLGNDLTCADVSGNSVIENVAAVIISTGKDKNQVASNIQAENVDDLHDGGNDKVYIFSTRNDTTSTEYDDVVRWLSPNLLYSKMIEAERLP
jgi:prepilin-type N-terminal cleavage/methylation domain-containing protein